MDSGRGAMRRASGRAEAGHPAHGCRRGRGSSAPGANLRPTSPAANSPGPPHPGSARATRPSRAPTPRLPTLSHFAVAPPRTRVHPSWHEDPRSRDPPRPGQAPPRDREGPPRNPRAARAPRPVRGRELSRRRLRRNGRAPVGGHRAREPRAGPPAGQDPARRRHHGPIVWGVRRLRSEGGRGMEDGVRETARFRHPRRAGHPRRACGARGPEPARDALGRGNRQRGPPRPPVRASRSRPRSARRPRHSRRHPRRRHGSAPAPR